MLGCCPNAFTPNALIDYRDDAISFQFHPDFTSRFARALVDAHGAPYLTTDDKSAAHRSLAADGDAAIGGGWIDRFLQT